MHSFEYDKVGTTLGPYRIDGLIGRGGMRKVYRVGRRTWVRTGKNRVVALKLM
ncbi:MAG: hypothetical protein KDB67_13460 [Gordonia sp.]|uniref:hypothetical protein n=1 Tax=Gordonia sp. (in: high G+C Gram-positive bacteria) TaxID=84139 RepID=UPI001DAD2FD6|nr:hypothetical protein [Gordonia sp. (in: high G+C Gram-positive bacteria)]MCB1295670.1 hypothetical protein [Gordonia sp. (in: high G+C Gram-positive bacteria)]HQV18587.1 hypothetical protein [Gordonia sp. (in: high G+C Gram-positive bacteria)]